MKIDRSNWFVVLGLAAALAACGGGDDGQGGAIDAAFADARVDGGGINPPDAGRDGGSDDGGPGDDGGSADGGTTAQENCGNGMDDDGDTLTDCDDPDCDTALLCDTAALSCPEGQIRTIVSATDLPRLIIGGETTTSTVNVAAPGQISRLLVQASLYHPWVGDVDLVLVGPGGQRIVLSESNGSSGNGYSGTLFDDDAAESIDSASAPFAGSFQPEEELHGLYYTPAQGEWHLEAIETVNDDDPDFDLGVLSDFTIGMCSCEDCEIGPTQCRDDIDNDGDELTDCQDPDCVDEPLCALDLLCGPGEAKVILTTPVPIAVPDASQVTRTITNATAGTVTNAALRFSATHTFNSDLFIRVKSPGAGGVTVTPLENNGSSNDGFTGTVLVDSAELSIDDASAPYTGFFRPENPFSGLDGTAAGGDWTITFGDDAGSDTGTITEFDLIICVQD